MRINTHQIRAFIRHVVNAHRKGHGVHSPFAYALCEQVFIPTGKYYAFARLDEVREKLESDHTILNIEDHGAGSKQLSSSARKVSDIARHGISTVRQSEMLYRLASWLGSREILELGTSLGLNALYLAMTGPNARVTTIEGAPELCAYASRLAQKNEIKNIEHVCGKFDDMLPSILARGRSYDLVYMDGHHAKEATLKYFELILPSLHERSVVVLDDIYWSQGMTEAWNILKGHPGVTLWLDGFRCGMLFFRKDVKEKTGYMVWTT